MKTLTFIIMFLPITVFTQKVISDTDAMSGRTTLYADRGLVVANNDQTVGFVIDAIMNNELKLRGLFVSMVNIGRCNEKDEIIILFDNGEKIIKKSIKDFNCDGEALFSLTDKELDLLRKQTLSKIRMTNGSSFESYTGDVKEVDKEYFITLLDCLDNNRLIIKN